MFSGKRCCCSVMMLYDCKRRESTASRLRDGQRRWSKRPTGERRRSSSVRHSTRHWVSRLDYRRRRRRHRRCCCDRRRHRSTVRVDQDLRSSSSPFAYLILTYQRRRTEEFGRRQSLRRIRAYRRRVAPPACAVDAVALPPLSQSARDTIALH